MNELTLLCWLLFALLGYLMGVKKNREVEGLFLGLILGIFGLLIMLFLKPKDK